jgi:uncharacterized protein involved in outer membrane biogenesis
MRKLKIVLGIVAALIVVAIAAVWLFLDVNKYRPLIQTRLEEQLRRKVTLGPMSLGLIPLRVTVQDVTIEEDLGFKSEFPFTQARQLDVRVRLLPLITGNVQVESIDLQEPSVELIRNADGVWNFASLSAPASSAEGLAGAKDPKSADTAETGTPAISLRRLSITGGKIAITDLLKKKQRAVYAPIDISLRDFSEGEPFSFDVTVHMPGSGSQEIRLEGTGGPLAKEGPATTPLQATLTLDDVDVGGLRQFLASESAATATGLLSGETQIESKAGQLAAKGKLNARDVQVGGVAIGYPIDLDYDLSSDVAAGLLQIASSTLKLGDTPLSVSGTVNTNPTPVEVDLRLQSGEVSIAEVARLASAFGIAFSPDTAVAGKLVGDVRARGPLSTLALNGNITGRDLKISGKNVPQPVEVKELNLALSPSEIQSNEFQATTGKTTVTGRMAVRNYTSKTPTVDMALRAPGATLPEIQNIARAYGVTGLDQLSGAGALSFDLRAAGPLESVASANIMRALNGKMNLNFDTMKLQGVDASRELARIGGFLKSDGSGKGYTDILKLTGNILVKNGIAETNDLEAKISEGTLAVAGKSDLATESLDLRATAILSKAFSDKVGGTGIGGYLTTALSNNEGETVIPVIISGTFDKPAFAPDAQAFLKMQRDRLIPGMDNPRGALSGILGGITGKKPAAEGEQPAAEEKPKSDPIKGVLDGILGGRK